MLLEYRARDSASVAAASAAPIGGAGGERACDHGYCWCSKCERPKPLANLRMRGNQNICFSDINSSVFWAARWKSNKNLNTWWQGLSEADQVAWYRKQQENGFGPTRKLDTVIYEEKSIEKANANEFDIDDYVPRRSVGRFITAAGGSGILPNGERQAFRVQIPARRVACPRLLGHPRKAGHAQASRALDSQGR